MRLTPEDTFAVMLKQVNDRLNNIEASRGEDEVPVQARSVEETETVDDATEQSVDDSPGWTWGESAWGFDIWN